MAKKTLQFQMMSVNDFGCNADLPGSPPLKKPLIVVY
jgi:hypothetical protein